MFLSLKHCFVFPYRLEDHVEKSSNMDDLEKHNLSDVIKVTLAKWLFIDNYQLQYELKLHWSSWSIGYHVKPKNNNKMNVNCSILIPSCHVCLVCVYKWGTNKCCHLIYGHLPILWSFSDLIWLTLSKIESDTRAIY